MLSCGAGNVQMKPSNIGHGLNPVEVPLSFRFDVLYTPKMCTPGHECETTPRPSRTPNVLPLGWLFVAAEMVKVDWIKVAMVTMHCIINFFKAWVPMNTRELVWKWWPNQWPVDLHRVAKTAHPQQSSLWRTLSLFKQSGNCDYWVGIEAKQAYRLLWKTSVSCHLV